MNRFVIPLVLACLCAFAARAGQATVTVDAHAARGQISPMMTGVNLLHHLETDEVLADGKIEGYLREMHTGVLRYPGGEVASYYHWEQPGWPGWKDAWEKKPAAKAYLSPKEAARNTNFLATDKYIALCRRVGAEPLIGVDIESGMIHGRVQDSLAEAVRWVTYCKEKNYGVKYWFIDNETYIWASYTNVSAQEYANYVKLFGTAMKKADPGIKIVGNWQGHFASPKAVEEWETILKTAGDVMDIADVHCYWAHGRASWDVWMHENPIRPHYPECKSTSYTDEFNRFHALVKKLGLHTQIAVFEWNVGPNQKEPASMPTPYECALIQSELLFQLTEGGAVMACFWPLHWPSPASNPRANRFLLKDRTFDPNPTFEIFKLYSQSLGQNLLTSRASDGHLIALSSLSKDGSTVRVYLLRKTGPGPSLDTAIELKGFDAQTAQAVTFDAPGPASDPSLKPLEVKRHGANWTATLPPRSLSMLTFVK